LLRLMMVILQCGHGKCAPSFLPDSGHEKSRITFSVSCLGVPLVGGGYLVVRLVSSLIDEKQPFKFFVSLLLLFEYPYKLMAAYYLHKQMYLPYGVRKEYHPSIRVYLLQ